MAQAHANKYAAIKFVVEAEEKCHQRSSENITVLTQ